MAIHWKIPFVSLRSQTQYTINIYDDSYSGTAVTLTGGAQPFVTEEDDDDDFYVPIRTQSGHISMIVESASVVNDIMPSTATDRPVTLTHESSGSTVVDWVGFLSPSLYTQPWEPTPYTLQLPVQSVMEAMRGVTFTQSDGYTSLLTLVNTISSYCPVEFFMCAPSDSPIHQVFVCNNNFRTFLTIPERAERNVSEIYECMSIYDCVEAFCKYFGVSLREYGTVMYFMVDNNSVEYLDIAPDGSSQEAQYGDTTLSMSHVKGNDNNVGFSKPYRLVTGEFETNRAKSEQLFSLGNFMKEFSMQGAYNNKYVLFNGTTEVLPYFNGSQTVSLLSLSGFNSGGQLQRLKTTDPMNASATAMNDVFYLISLKSKVGSPETALKLNIPRKIYINSDETVILNIAGNIDYEGAEFVGDRLYAKMKVGNYWLHSYQQGGYAVPTYEWTTTESTFWMLIEDGAIKTVDYTITSWGVRSKMDAFSGFVISMPEALSAGYYAISFEFLANAQESTSEFGNYSIIDHLVCDFKMSLLRATADLAQAVPDFDKNTVIRSTSGDYAGVNDESTIITTRRGVQFGTGMALNSSKAYITTKYDQQGIVRKANFYGSLHKIITVDLDIMQQPIDGYTFTDDGATARFTIISQSRDWRDDVVTAKLIKL